MDLQIYQAFHKSFPHNPHCGWIRPVGVNGFTFEGHLSDATGTHISHLNPYYCELTVLYWALMNRSSKYVGFFHYRRYLNLNLSNGISDSCSIKLKDFPGILASLTDDALVSHVASTLAIYDFIIPKKSFLSPTLEEQYIQCVQPAPWLAFIDAIRDLFPNQLDPQVFFRATSYAPICNIFITSDALFRRYALDLFSIVDRVYQQVGTPFDSYNNRYPGFLAERFLSYWIHINKMTAAEFPILLLD